MEIGIGTGSVPSKGTNQVRGDGQRWGQLLIRLVAREAIVREINCDTVEIQIWDELSEELLGIGGDAFVDREVDRSDRVLWRTAGWRGKLDGIGWDGIRARIPRSVANVFIEPA